MGINGMTDLPVPVPVPEEETQLAFSWSGGGLRRWDTGMPMPKLIFSMPIPSYDKYAAFPYHR
jgi:hypothetical protein